jgi:tetratricopeptide (TPR) repeat protein
VCVGDQRSVSSQLDAALAQERSLEWSAALDRYSRLRSTPDQTDRCRALLGLARCLLQTRNRGETEEATDALEEARALAAGIDDESLSGQQLLLWGHIQEHQGYLQRALESYSSALRLLPRSATDHYVEATITLASALRRRGELASALVHLTGLDETEVGAGQRVAYQQELGAVMIARGEYAGAAEVLRRGLTHDAHSASPRLRMLLAEALRHTGGRDEAKLLLDEAIALCTREGSTMELSEAYSHLGHWHEDNESYASAVHAFDDSLKQDELSEDRVGQARAKRNMARIFRKTGDSSRATELLNDAKEVLFREDQVELALLWQEEAELALTGSKPNYTEAIRLFTGACEIIEADGDERAIAVAQRRLARAYREDDDLDEAERLLKEALPALEQRGDLRELDELLDDLGEVFLEQGFYERAQEVLDRSLQLDIDLGRVTSRARSLMLLGRVAHEKGDHDSALKYLAEAVELYSEIKQDVGLSEALQHMAAWHLDRGQTKAAINLLRRGLAIDSRVDDSLGRARARRLLAAAYRQRGDLARADEYLDDARKDLAPIDDPVERALIEIEDARIHLARGAADDAIRHAQTALGLFQDVKDRPVDEAICERLLAMAHAYRGDYEEAQRRLDAARGVFEERHDIPELDELHDDLAEVWLLQGRLQLARESAMESLKVGGSRGWSFGKGRSLLLLAQIGMSEGGEAAHTSHQYIEEALALYKEQSNEAGECRADMVLGDWFLGSGDLAKALASYKHARATAHRLRDLRSVAACQRKLATIHLSRHEVQRAEDALRDADEALQGITDPRARAPLKLDWGRLLMAKGAHAQAIPPLQDAVAGFHTLKNTDAHRTALRLLSTCLQADGQTGPALECVREMGEESTFMYNVLLEDLHPRIAQASRPNFVSGNYKEAVNAAFAAVEELAKEATAHLPQPRNWADSMWRHIEALAEASDWWGPSIKNKKGGVKQFGEFASGCSRFFYNESKHERVSHSPTSAFAAITAAHIIAETLELQDLPWALK